MIQATEADRPDIEAFFREHVVTAMFPMSNLARHGMAGGHPRAMNFWLRWSEGEITDVLAVSDEGRVFPQCPTGPWGDVGVVMAGRSVISVIGAADQVAGFRKAVGLDIPAAMDGQEPHFALSLDDLIMPDPCGMTLHRLQDVPLDALLTWRAAFCVESLSCPPDQARDRATRDITGYLDLDSHRVLIRGDTPLSMTGFNAILPEVVQVGGVYTPPELRSKGFARLAVALHLAEARANGVKDAVLSAANDAAAKAYEAIGFRHVGQFSIVDFADPQVIRG